MKNSQECDPRSLFDRFGGLLNRNELNRDSGLGLAWTIGDMIVDLARQRLTDSGTQPSINFDIGIVEKPLLNAVALHGKNSYVIALFWPLPLVIQGVAAAIWAHPSVAPWIGNTARLKKRFEPDISTVPGFDLYLALKDKIQFEPSLYRSGVRIDDVEAIVAAGEDRWEAFLATWNSALRFVWGHEIAHVLYGHVDLVHDQFGFSELYESEGVTRGGCPEALSQFMEYVADMDAAMNIFSLFYASYFGENIKAESEDFLSFGASTLLGVLIGIYVLWQGLLLSRKKRYSSHPPIQHRAAWVIGAESHGLNYLQKKICAPADADRKVAALRSASSRLLDTVAEVHQSLAVWMRNLDDSAEDSMNNYVSSIQTRSEAFFDRLDKAQKVHG